MRPCGSANTTMSSNCWTLDSRPSVVMVYWKTWPLGTGGWPIWPAATWTFCCEMAATMSSEVRLRTAIFSGSSQTRML